MLEKSKICSELEVICWSNACPCDSQCAACFQRTANVSSADWLCGHNKYEKMGFKAGLLVYYNILNDDMQFLHVWNTDILLLQLASLCALSAQYHGKNIFWCVIHIGIK